MRNFVEVEQELDQAKSLGYRQAWAVDNIVTVDEPTLLRFDAACASRGLNWSGMTRPELAAKQSGLFAQLTACTEIAMGIESVDEDELERFSRSAKRDYCAMCEIAVRNIKVAGIRTNAFVMLGGPMWTFHGFVCTLSFLHAVVVDTVSWSFFNPTPRTVLEGMDPQWFGFYRWPFGDCGEKAETIVRAAMILSGTWWSGWDDGDLHFVSDAETFGVLFTRQGIALYQRREARSAIGDCWQMWLTKGA
jgi:hypothetical protein